MAVGGAYLTLSAFDAFYFGMVNGRGWIAIALVIFASWKPERALLGALLFLTSRKLILTRLFVFLIRVLLKLISFLQDQVLKY